MRTVLVQKKYIKKVIQKDDACLVIMDNDKTYVCEEAIAFGIYKQNGNLVKKDYIFTVDYIEAHQGDTFIKLPLKANDGERK